MRAVCAMAASAWRFKLAALPIQMDSSFIISMGLPLTDRVFRW